MFSLKHIITLLFFGASAAGVYWGILPERVLIEANKTKMQEIEAAMTIAKTQLGEIDKSIAFYESLDGAMKDRVLFALPANTDTPNVIVTLDRIITDSGLAISDISLQEALGQSVNAIAESQQQEEVAPASSLQNIAFGIDAVGDYASIKHLISSLENLLRVNDIDSLTITPVGQEQESPQDENLLQIQLQGKMYALPRRISQ